MKKGILFILAILLWVNLTYSQTLPVLISPSNHSTYSTTTPTLVWSYIWTVNLSPTYQVQVSSSDPNVVNDLVVDVTVHGWSGMYYVPASAGLIAGHTYYWHVSADGGSHWSLVFDFTPSGGATIITAPNLISPIDGDNWVTTTPTLVWSYFATSSLTYKIEISKTNDETHFEDISNLVYTTTVTGWSGTCTIPVSAGLLASTQYYWRVQVDGASNPWSDIWTFTTTGSSTSASKPYLSAPVNGSTWETTTPTLYWWYVTTASTVLYTIDVCADDNTFGSGTVSYHVTGGGSANFTLPTLLAGTTYYWRVSANGGTPSDVWSFTPQGSAYGGLPAFTNLKISQSVDLATWVDVSGNLNDGFELSLLTGNAYHYLTLGSGTTTNVPIASGDFPFYLTSYPSGFFAYWAGRGVTASATGWQAEMWKIINAIDPILYIHSDGAGHFTLYDGLLKNLNPSSTAPFQIDDTYLLGSYIVTGNIESTGSITSNAISVKITFDDGKPYFTDMQLESSLVQVSTLPSPYSAWDPWTLVNGNLTGGFALTLGGTPGLYHSLNIASANTNTAIADNYYGFKLSQSNLPAGFVAYWLAKDPNINSTYAAAHPASQEAKLYKIISGVDPILYVNVSSGVFTLVDGFYHDFVGIDIPFRIDDDYPNGDYTVVGTLHGQNGKDSDPISIVMHLNNGVNSIVVSNLAGQAAGATVSVPVTMALSSTTSITNSLIGKFTYDPSMLTFKYGYAGTGTLINSNGWNITFFEITPGQLQFVASGTSPITSNGTLFKLNLQIVPTVATSTAAIDASTSDWYVNGVNSVFSISSGSIGFTGPVSGTSTLRGDATLDFVVDINDVLAVIYHIYGLSALTGQALTNAAVSDGVAGVSLDDAVAILSYIANGYWGTTPPPSPAVVAASLQFPGVTLNQAAGIIEFPIQVTNAANINSVEVRFLYDPQEIDYQAFVALIINQNKFTNASQISPGVAQFTFTSTEGIKGEFIPGLMMLRFVDGSLPTGSVIRTQYSINSNEYKEGPTYKIGTGIVTDVNNSLIVLPQDFKLSQNYPNPFNPTTRISFSLPKNSFVTLKIYDMLGREVRTLVNNEMNAGFYTQEWNGENQSGQRVTSGVYIYRITAGNFVSNKKMILIK